jgi:hypothetical protein
VLTGVCLKSDFAALKANFAFVFFTLDSFANFFCLTFQLETKDERPPLGKKYMEPRLKRTRATTISQLTIALFTFFFFFLI